VTALSATGARIAVLGAGAWGTAIAAVLSLRHAATLWARDAAQAEAIARERANRKYLPEVELPAALAVSARWPEGADLYLAATPVAGLREVAARVGRAPLVWLCKGFESGTGLLPHEVVAGARGVRAPGGALSGPSFALEVARGLPCALTLASRDADFARTAAAALHGGRLRVYYSDDLAGVEIGGAVKNVMAIAVGIADGLALGQNARAALITRGLAEITRLGIALGGRAQTFMGLAGAGDLILTATGDLSRNRRVGLELARGRRLGEILGALGHVAEGVHTAREVLRLAARHRVEMPITQAVSAVLEGKLAAPQAVELLLARDPKEEGRAGPRRAGGGRRVSPRRRSRAAATPRTRRPRRRSKG
jgi:glycerol-3-phosphate dehydrogenase (NAD(P)+)